MLYIIKNEWKSAHSYHVYSSLENAINFYLAMASYVFYSFFLFQVFMYLRIFRFYDRKERRAMEICFNFIGCWTFYRNEIYWLLSLKTTIFCFNKINLIKYKGLLIRCHYYSIFWFWKCSKYRVFFAKKLPAANFIFKHSYWVDF